MNRVTPSTPSDDLRAHADAPAIGGGVLTEDLARFCESGVSVVIGWLGRGGLPLAGVALGCRVKDDGTVRVLLRRAANAGLVETVEAGDGLAVTFTEPLNHRSIQLKTSRAATAAPEAADLEMLARQCARFRGILERIDYTPEFAAFYTAYRPQEIVAIDFTPEQGFVQTPGPGAGSAFGS